MALIDDFRTRFPEFPTAIVDQYIPVLEPVWPCYYGGAYDACGQEIILNMLAHLLSIETSSGSSGLQQEASRTVGSVSISYVAPVATSSASRQWWWSTKYGQRFVQLTAYSFGALPV